MKALYKYWVIALVISLITSCASIQHKFIKPEFTTIPASTKHLDIPKYCEEGEFKDEASRYWNFSKQKEKQLGLEPLELSNDSLVYRIWMTNPIGIKGQPHSLLEIKHDNDQWTATLYTMFVDYKTNTQTETIANYEKITIIPKYNDWDYIIDSLYQLRFDKIPTEEEIINYKDNDRYPYYSIIYSFEYATKYQYRFYHYNQGTLYANYWQTKNALAILDFLDYELEWRTILNKSKASLAKDNDHLDHECIDYISLFRLETGAFFPIGKLKNNLGISPNIGLQFGMPIAFKYSLKIGLSGFIPIKPNDIAFYVMDTTLSGKPEFSGTGGIWLERLDILKKC